MFELQVDEEVTLRLHDMADVEAYFHLIKSNRDHIGQYMDWVNNHETVADTRDDILYARKQFGQREEIATKIYFQGELVGSIDMIFRNKELRIGEVGYWLDKDFTGQGIVTRAVRAMTDYSLTTQGLHKIIIRAMPHNERSLAIPIRLGFKHQGVDVHAVLHEGQYYDFDVYYALEDDWKPTIQSPEFGFRVDDEIELRVLEPRHADAVFALVDANRDYLRQWLPWVDDTKSSEDTLNFIHSGLTQYADNDGLQLGIWYQGEYCGNCGYHYWDFSHKKTEIGYWLAQAHTGQGIMTRTVKTLVDYAFAVLDLHRVEIQCAVGNRASCAIPERLGFTHEGVVRGGEHINDEFHDLNIYAVLADEWGL